MFPFGSNWIQLVYIRLIRPLLYGGLFKFVHLFLLLPSVKITLVPHCFYPIWEGPQLIVTSIGKITL